VFELEPPLKSNDEVGALRYFCCLFVLFLTAGCVSTPHDRESAQPATAAESSAPPKARIFYVRQTVGDDANDGLSPQSAWRTLSMLAEVIQAGDTVYVGRGLYREMLTLRQGGTAERPITLIADTTGEHTTDPPGIVMITGADAVDEKIFVPEPTPGVYKATGLDKLILNAVEMDGPQYRYPKAFDTPEHIREGMTQRDVVTKLPSLLFYDRETKAVYIHTSDGKSPATHEIELIRRNYGIVAYGAPYVSVIGFTFRHMGTAGLNFEDGSHHGIAIDNRSYGAWQGIRVFGSEEVLVANNELFRNSNSGVYFAYGSTRGYAIGNVLYQNAKGIRWSSDSTNGLALDNVAFANREAGIAIERSDAIRVIRNTLVDNEISQLRLRSSRYSSEGNCFEAGPGKGFVAGFSPFERYATLAEFRRAKNQDFSSREACGPLPDPVDVHSLHAETLSYEKRARDLRLEPEGL
jgi:parallel beta-helix repeat protein